MELAAFYDAANMSSSFHAEMMNVRFVQEYYGEEHVNALNYQLAHPPHLYSHVIVGVDPTGGGGSDLALVAIGVPNNPQGEPLRIMGIGLFQCCDQLNYSTAQHTRAFLDTLVGLPCMSRTHVNGDIIRTPIYVACENMPMACTEIVLSQTGRYPNVFVVDDDRWKTNKRGMSIHDSAHQILLANLGNCIVSKSFGFLKDCFGLSNSYKPGHGEGTMGRCLVNILRGQYLNMGFVKKGSTVSISGKRNGKKDDGVMASGHALVVAKLMPKVGHAPFLKISKISHIDQP